MSHVFGFIFFHVLICDFLFQKSQIFKVNPMGWGHFPICRARLDYNLGPLLWDPPPSLELYSTFNY